MDQGAESQTRHAYNTGVTKDFAKKLETVGRILGVVIGLQEAFE